MLRVLVVDDDAGKVQRITRALSDIEGFSLTAVTHETNMHSAKVRLEQTGYDLMILDIAIPSRVDQEVVRDGGIKLLDEIVERDRYKKPNHVIGITAYPDIYQAAAELFSQRLLTIVHFDPTSDEWIAPLRARVKHIIAAKADLQTNVEEYKSYLAITCALESPELSSIRQLGWGWEQIHIPTDDTIYYRGEFERLGERRVVYAAAAARMGMPAAAILAMKMIWTFRPKYLAMAGITAGISGKTKLGDIIVADPSWDYGNGKWMVDKGVQSFMPAPHQVSLTPALRGKFKLMGADVATLANIKANWVGEKPDHELSLLVGPVASGASVLADGSTAERIKTQQHREVLGIEMETYGIFAAAEEATEPRPTVFSMKSVVDFADGNKDDRYQKYAAFTSAQALKHFVENHI
jgi:nucleoside phosphorylase/CheY-like chemotaxis protein